MIYYISDTHFFHKNIIKYCNRPFDSIENMNDTLITNWNNIVTNKDTIYHLGDFGFGHKTLLFSIFNKLNGNKRLIRGSHDVVAEKLPWLSVNSILEIYDTTTIILCHYALRTWPRQNRGSIHLFGHSHGLLDNKVLNSFDVGADCNEFKPITIKKFIS